MGVRGAGQREARVVAAARELFAEQGFAATSMRQIAERAGVSVGTVANTGTKAQLLDQTFTDVGGVALLGRLSCLDHPERTGLSFGQEVDAIFEDWFDRLRDEPRTLRDYFVGQLATGPRDTSEVDQQIIMGLRRRLLAHHPHLDERRAEAIGVAMMSIHTACLFGVLLGRLQVDEAQRTASCVVATLTDGL